MLGSSSLFVKEEDVVFRALFQPKACFETDRTVWGPEHLCPKNYYFSIIN